MWRRLANWHEDEWLLTKLASPTGQVVLLILIALVLPSAVRWPVAIALGLSMLVPTRRIEILATGSLWVLYQWLPEDVRAAGPLAVATGLAFALTLFFVILAAARRFKALPTVVRRFPIASLHVLLLSLLALCGFIASRELGASIWGAGVAALAALIPLVLWRSSYIVLAGRHGTIATSRFTDHLACWLPLWGGTITPLGKGYDYLRQRTATDSIALARSRAGGLKLLLLALVWNLIDRRFVLPGGGTGLGLPSILGGWSMPVPELAAAIAAGPDGYGLGVRWLSMTLEFLRSVIQLAASGHVVIGSLRLFGFNVFRNTYKPLLAQTIVEFWNRYYYYFKELLVEFFFYPAFLALAKQRPAVRIVLSVLAAATVGNLYYHMVRDYQWFVDGGAGAFAQWIGSRGIYCVVLGLGVAVSMLRERRARGLATRARAPWTQLRAILGVWLFFATLHVWSVAPHTLRIEQRADFLLRLFIP